MWNKSPMPQSHHFNDYGFDPQIDFFQVLEEAKEHKKENYSIDTLKFKLQKPISKEDLIRTTLHKKKKRWFFWRKAFIFFPWPISVRDDCDVHMARATNFRAAAGSISGPVYLSANRSGSSSPYRTTAIPYLSLRELNREERQHRIPTSSMSGPVYSVLS